MADVTTLEAVYQPLMELGSVRTPRCAVCGRRGPLEQHHIVWKSWGQVYRDGERLEKPTVTLCGFGSNLGPGYCHGKAHHRMLHFRNGGGRLEYLETEEPTEYAETLGMDGWRPVRTGVEDWEEIA